MKLHYHPETDSAYVEFSKKPGTETREVADGLNIDLGADGELIGIEIEDASKHLDSAVIEASNRRRGGQMTAEGLRIPFYFEYELRARHPQGVIAHLDPYESYYWSHEPGEDQPPYPVTLFVVDTEEVEDTYVRTAAQMSRMSLPIFVSCVPVLSNTGILGRSWHPLWEPDSARLGLSALRAYQWDSLYHRMCHRPVEGR